VAAIDFEERELNLIRLSNLLTTRSDVDISREFRFRHTGAAYAGIPIVASNMDATGTFEMARALAAHKLSTALHKYYEVDAYVEGPALPPPRSHPEEQTVPGPADRVPSNWQRQLLQRRIDEG